jgi:AcrR family transcriptional regulator
MASSPGNPGRHVRNPRGSGERLRADLIEAASELLRGGATHDSLSLRAVARAVGIAATSVYLHFPDKMSLLLAVYAEKFGELARTLAGAIAQETAPARQLRAACLAYCEFAARDPGAYQVLFSVAGTGNMTPRIPPGQRPGAAVVQAVQDVITRCMETGDMARADPYTATLCLWAALHGLITLRAARPYVAWPSTEDLIDTLLATSLGTHHAQA